MRRVSGVMTALVVGAQLSRWEPAQAQQLAQQPENTPATPTTPAQPSAPEPAAPEPPSASAPVSPEPASAEPASPGLFERASAGESSPGLFERASGSPAPASPAAAELSAAPAAELPLDLGGYMRGTFFAGKVPERSNGDIKAAYGELSLLLRTKRESYGQGLAEVRFRHGFAGYDPGLAVDLREGYVSLYLGALDLRLGQQIVVWGRADAFNPTNNITPFDLSVRSPIEDDRRLGNVGARAFYRLEPLRFEAVWMPLYRPAVLPVLPLEDLVTVDQTNFPSPQIDNGLGALRVHLELASFELSASYLRGHAPLPGFALAAFGIGEDAFVSIARTAYEHQVFGFDFSTAIGEAFALRGEAAYRVPTSDERQIYEPRPDLQYVLGADRAFGDVSVIVQYLGRYVFDWEREEGPEMPITPQALAGFMELTGPLAESIPASINEELEVRNQMLFSQLERVQHLASARVEWTGLHDTLSLSALGMLNFSTEEALLYPKVGYRLSDAISVYGGAEIYLGPDGTLFGTIEEPLSAAYAELRVGF